MSFQGKKSIPRITVSRTPAPAASGAPCPRREWLASAADDPPGPACESHACSSPRPGASLPSPLLHVLPAAERALQAARNTHCSAGAQARGPPALRTLVVDLDRRGERPATPSVGSRPPAGSGVGQMGIKRTLPGVLSPGCPAVAAFVGPGPEGTMMSDAVPRAALGQLTPWTRRFGVFSALSETKRFSPDY